MTVEGPNTEVIVSAGWCCKYDDGRGGGGGSGGQRRSGAATEAETGNEFAL